METLLIANRGEIARRVLRTARALGVRTVAVYTDADARALHVREADHAVRIPGYLDVDAIVRAATDSGADAVHPGYGFLSERADLPRALAAAGIGFVGPTGEVMEAMGRKDKAREIAVAAGVPVVPQGDEAATTAEPGRAWGPVLVKAAAGGGGKGMRVVRSVAELAEAQAAAAREAAKAFGDDTLLLEKYVERGRHIEVQVFGDTHGNVVHLFERDCSTQRRHQKVLEEAPAPTLTAAQRALVTESAVALARSVGYTGAGTVEFLLDEASGEAYFLEMNTRLQVEHPVTEEVIRVRGSRVDLVELQLRIADGEPLGFTQSDVTVTGHAIEARVYAEDPWHGFLPQAGTASYVGWPTAEGVRVDHALESGQVVGTGFDPMLGKVIAVGGDREQARRCLVDALGATAILGLTTNTGFLRELAASEAFRYASIDTAWLDRTEIARPAQADAALLAALASLPAALAEAGHSGGPLAADGWRDGGAPAPIRPAVVGAPALRVTGIGRAELVGEAGLVSWAEALCTAVGEGTDAVAFAVDGRPVRGVARTDARGIDVVAGGERSWFERITSDREHIALAGDGSVLAPMPGTVLDVRVAEGQAVAAGDVLGVMEAMKMELSLTAPADGTVSAVAAAPGDQVALGQKLFQVDVAD